MTIVDAIIYTCIFIVMNCTITALTIRPVIASSITIAKLWLI